MQKSPREILNSLIDGNTRFMSGESQSPRSDIEYIVELENGQNPRAVILACADSRYPLTKIFDQGFGDLFEIRVAGNSLNNDGIASIQYAISILETKLVIVLGHTNCGACLAAIATGTFTKEIKVLLKPLKKQINREIRLSDDPVNELVIANVRQVTRQLTKKLPESVLVVGGVYQLESGKVKIL